MRKVEFLRQEIITKAKINRMASLILPADKQAGSLFGSGTDVAQRLMALRPPSSGKSQGCESRRTLRYDTTRLRPPREGPGMHDFSQECHIDGTAQGREEEQVPHRDPGRADRPVE